MILNNKIIIELSPLAAQADSHKTYVTAFFQCGCSQLNFYSNIIPGCAEKLKSEMGNHNLIDLLDCVNRKGDEMRKSDSMEEFIGTREYEDMDSALSFFAQPDQMKACKQLLEKNIQTSVFSIMSMYEQCIQREHKWVTGQTWATASETYGW